MEKNNPYKGEAGGKIILFGEHLVNHGGAGVAIPYNGAKTEVTLTPKDENGYAMDAKEVDIFTLVVDLVAKSLQVDVPTGIWTLKLALPAGSGGGMSASGALAAARCLSHYYHQDLDDERARKAIMEVEKHFHGNPSGLDGEVILQNKVMGMQNGAFFGLDVPIPKVKVVYDGRPSRITAEMVAISTKYKEENPQKFAEMIKMSQKWYEKYRKEPNKETLKGIFAESRAVQAELGVVSKTMTQKLEKEAEKGKHGKVTGAGGIIKAGLVVYVG